MTPGRGTGLRVLVVEDDPVVRGVLLELLRHDGFELFEAADGATAVDLFSRNPVDIVITDVRMPVMDGLEVLARIKRLAPDACVVVMTGFGTEETVVRALRNGASNYFKKPVNVAEFSYALGVMADLVRARRVHRLDPGTLVRESHVLSLGPDPEAAYPAVAHLTATLASQPFDIEAVRIGLLEMIANAIEHGNLGITREEKLAALRAGTFRELCASRAASPPGRDRRVRVESDLTPERVGYRVIDEGPGFDWRSLPDPANAEGLFAASGRGIIVTRLCMDEVLYNGRGNEVSILKRRSPGDSGLPPGGEWPPDPPGAVPG